MIDRKALTRTLVGVYDFYGRELTEFAIRIWCDALEDFDAGQVEKAMKLHLRDPDAGQYLPKPADVIRHLRGNVADAALIAWGDVLQVVRAGGHGVGKLPAPALKAIQDMGGLSVIGRADESQNGFLQRRFVDAFKAYATREHSEPALLAGAPVLKLAGSVQ